VDPALMQLTHRPVAFLDSRAQMADWYASGAMRRGRAKVSAARRPFSSTTP
jgi:hypothetical protein